MLKNPYFYRKNFQCFVKGFIVPKEYIGNCTLADLERILGFRRERLKQGAAFAQLYTLPAMEELEYFGSTATPSHRWEERRADLSNRNIEVISQSRLINAAYRYLNPSTKLIKVIPLKDHNPMLSEDQNWPRGIGAMQYKLIRKKAAFIIDVIEDYPNGKFK